MSNTISELTKERAELFVKIEDLNVYMTNIFEKDEEEMRLLEEQHESMCAYFSVLTDRIKLIENRKKKRL